MRNYIKKIQQKWLYSIVGLWTAIREERSLWAYLLFTPAVIALGIVTKLSYLQWAVTIVLLFLMFAVEIINTSIEAAVDTISFQYNVNVKKIKDIASAATLVTTVGSLIGIALILIPKIQELF